MLSIYECRIDLCFFRKRTNYNTTMHQTYIDRLPRSSIIENEDFYSRGKNGPDFFPRKSLTSFHAIANKMLTLLLFLKYFPAVGG